MKLTLYRRDNRKRNGQRWRRYAVWLGRVAVLSILGVAAYRWHVPLKAAVAAAPALFFENSYFFVREIQVRGGEKVGGDEIVAMAGLRQGMNIWKIEPGGIEKKVAKHPWVRRVLVRRDFPRRIVIEVEERTPKAIVALGQLYYVDADGVVFKEVGAGENVNFPLLTGLRTEQLAKANPALRGKIQDAVRLADLMAKDAHTLSEIHFDESDRLVVYTTAFPVALKMGWGEWDAKLKRLDRVLALWKGNEERLASLDASFNNQVVARLRKVQGFKSSRN
ncbi:MAG: Cell division protein FtsQ [Deltaproteobacteria bacterium]|jgi:cell division septal protein FtsQ|nr:Cell division protein FtsQ [Deltaproteobacteria bacterium]